MMPISALVGCVMSRHPALRRWQGRQLVDQLAAQNILID
jgi:hypothetical protein